MNQNIFLFIHENASENNLSEMAAILSRGDEVRPEMSEQKSYNGDILKYVVSVVSHITQSNPTP